jgi:putative ABC transport system substrate-binding protein
MKRAAVSSILVAVVLLALGVKAEAQQPRKIPLIGYLFGQSPSTGSVRIDPFRQGLRELGYVEGKNIVIEYRYAEGKLDRLPALYTEDLGGTGDVSKATEFHAAMNISEILICLQWSISPSCLTSL